MGAAGGACWSDLPEGLIDLIINRFEHHGPDVVRCQVVCTSWYSVAQSVLNKRRISFPLLLIPNEQDPCTRTLVNVDTNETSTVHLPELHDRWICCTTNGWLVTIGLSRPYAMHLLNPHSQEQVSLPSRSTFMNPQLDSEAERHTPVPGFISTTRSDPNFVLVVIYGNSMHLALCMPGDRVWTHVDDTTGVCKLGTLQGICNFNLLFYKPTGTFYIIDNDAFVKKLDLELHLPCACLSPKAVRIASPLETHLDQKYLVESVVSGDFWVVLRNVDIPDGLPEGDTMWYDTVSFTVLRMDLVTKEMSRVDSLGQEALFLGHNGSVSVIVGGEGWCRPNCIYFLDHYVSAYSRSGLGCYDMGVFHLPTTRVEKQELLTMQIGKEDLNL